MNRFKKYCPNVWVAECEELYKKGDIIEMETKYSKKVKCEVFNLILSKNGKYYFSIVRCGESYAEKKANKYLQAKEKTIAKQNEYLEKAEEGKDFLVMGEPIKVGHSSEKKHRGLIERNMKRRENAYALDEKIEEQQNKADYWEMKANEITLAVPSSFEHFSQLLEKAKEYHERLKKNPDEREHAYSLTYANKAVKELEKKVKLAKILWGVQR